MPKVTSNQTFDWQWLFQKHQAAQKRIGTGSAFLYISSVIASLFSWQSGQAHKI